MSIGVFNIEDFKNDLHLLLGYPRYLLPQGHLWGRAPQRVPTWMGGGERGWVLFHKLSKDMSILLYKKWSKKVENLARGLIWVLLEYPKTPPPRAPPKVRARTPKGRPRRWRQGAWVLFHKISNDMSILGFVIMIYICLLKIVNKKFLKKEKVWQLKIELFTWN